MAEAAKKSGSEGRSKSWYNEEKKNEPAAAKKAEGEAEAEHPMMRELRATLERHATERDDMHKRHGEEYGALLKRDDLIAGAPVQGAGDAAGGSA